LKNEYDFNGAKGYLQLFVERLKAGHTLTEDDERQLKRVAIALAAGRKHHEQARAVGS
jgi:hypothetical protein